MIPSLIQKRDHPIFISVCAVALISIAALMLISVQPLLSPSLSSELLTRNKMGCHEFLILS
jgi:hypothetical protein